MLDVGPLEVMVILVVAVMVFGPERLPDFARQAARMLHTLRGFARNATSDLRSELGPEYADLKLRDLDPRTAIRQQVMEAMSEIEEEERVAREKEQEARRETAGRIPPFDAEAT